jgi:hypothetical protein
VVNRLVLQRSQSPLLFMNMKTNGPAVFIRGRERKFGREWFAKLVGVSDAGRKVNRGGIR